jgi:single-strand DNA-binding protein
MAGVNKVILVGHLGRDPELRYAQSGTAVANVTIATTERRKNRDGEWADQTEWHRLVLFGKTAETLARYCKKGKQIYVEGRIQSRSWEDKETGQKRYTTEILVNQMIMLGRAGEGGDSGGEFSGGGQDMNQESSTPTSAAAGAAAGGGGLDDDDDLPF